MGVTYGLPGKVQRFAWGKHPGLGRKTPCTSVIVTSRKRAAVALDSTGCRCRSHAGMRSLKDAAMIAAGGALEIDQ